MKYGIGKALNLGLDTIMSSKRRHFRSIEFIVLAKAARFMALGWKVHHRLAVDSWKWQKVFHAKNTK